MTKAQLKDYNKVRDSVSLSISGVNDVMKLQKISNFCEMHLKSDPVNVIHFGQQGLVVAQKLNNTTELSKLWRFIGYGHSNNSQINKAIASFDKSLHIAKLNKDSLNITRTYAALGFCYDAIGEVETAKALYHKALPIARELNEYETIQTILCYQAIMLRREGEYKESITMYDQTLDFSRLHNLDTVRILRNKAQLLTNMGNYSDALDIYHDVKKTSDPHLNHLLFADINHNIAFILKCNKLHNEALDYYNQVLDYFLRHENFLHCAIIYESMGEIKLEMNELDHAEAYLLDGLNLRKEHGLGRTGTALEYLGLVKLEQNKYEEAYNYLSMALDSFDKVNNKRRISETLCHMSQLHLKTDEVAKSIAYADSSKRIATTHEFNQTHLLALEHLIDAYKQIQNYEQVFILQQELEIIKEKVDDPEKLFEISQQIVLQKVLDNKKFQSEPESRSITNWIFGGILILLPIGIWIFYSRKQLLTANKKKGGFELSTQKTNYISTQEVKKLKIKLHDVMSVQKPYLDTELKLNELAKAISVSDKKLSALLNNHLNISFYDYINQWRIQEFLTKAKESHSNEFSIVGLAFICGFKSKSSFYRCFNKEVGMSPSVFLKNLHS